MIVVSNVHKRYFTPQGVGKWVLNGIDLVFPTGVSVGLIGVNGAGKSTLLRIIGGVDFPTKGYVERKCRVSWPMGYGGGLEPTLTGRQNAKFVCRVHGHDEDLADRIKFIQDFAAIGEAFDRQVTTYSSGMRSRLQFAMSLAFNFDVYISDEVTSAGDAIFRKKASQAFNQMSKKSSMIMVSHNESTLLQFCKAGVLILDGKTHWYDDINEALYAYKETITK